MEQTATTRTAAETEKQGKVTLNLERTFDATPKELYEAFTTAEAIADWFGPQGMSTEVATLDVKIGGRYDYTMRDAEGAGYRVVGEFKTLSPHDLLSFTWKWVNEELSNPETLVTFRFVAQGDKTLLRMTHKGFLDETASNSHNQGWSSAFDCLAALLAN